MDNTDVFFKLAQASIKGVVMPEWMGMAPGRAKRKQTRAGLMQ
jgi:hypothetical protein